MPPGAGLPAVAGVAATTPKAPTTAATAAKRNDFLTQTSVPVWVPNAPPGRPWRRQRNSDVLRIRVMQEVIDGVFHWTAVHPNTGLEASSHYVEPARTLVDPMAPEEVVDRLAGM